MLDLADMSLVTRQTRTARRVRTAGFRKCADNLLAHAQAAMTLYHSWDTCLAIATRPMFHMCLFLWGRAPLGTLRGVCVCVGRMGLASEDVVA